jgi:flavin reductase (DIM6/NTAB) family NADH-FMN oxidoreductase RutF
VRRTPVGEEMQRLSSGAAMSADVYYYEPARGHGLAHDPLNAIIAPRPIGWISSRDPDGLLNLAPYSFFNVFSYRPPIIGFASGGRKDSLRNIEQTREFGWSLVTRPLAEAMNRSSATVAAHVDEFVLAGVTPAASRLIAVPRVAESPVTFECRLTQIVQLQDAQARPVNTWLVLGEVVGVHIATSLIAEGRYDTTAAQPIVRGGGPADYFEVHPDARFQMPRPG